VPGSANGTELAERRVRAPLQDADHCEEEQQVIHRLSTPRPQTTVDDLDGFFEALHQREEQVGHADLDLVHGNHAVSEGPASVVPQTEAMVLNLDDPYESSAAVLELELERMDLEELQAFEAKLEAASVASAASRAQV
jgi:hypothetical protein